MPLRSQGESARPNNGLACRLAHVRCERPVPL